MAEISHRVPLTLAQLAVLIRRNNHTVYRAPQQPAGPVAQQVPDVDANRFRNDRDGTPSPLRREDLEPSLVFMLEEKRNGAVVAVGAGAQVGSGVVVGRRGRVEE